MDRDLVTQDHLQNQKHYINTKLIDIMEYRQSRKWYVSIAVVGLFSFILALMIFFMAQGKDVTEGWKEILLSELNSTYMQNLSKFLREQITLGKTIYPPGNQIFNAFNKTPFPKVKVVILGQDPYHGESQAHGLSFSVKESIKKPPSLQNIFKELQDDIQVVKEAMKNNANAFIYASERLRKSDEIKEIANNYEYPEDGVNEELDLNELVWDRGYYEVAEKGTWYNLFVTEQMKGYYPNKKEIV